MNIQLPKTTTKKLYIYIGYGTYNLNDIDVCTFEAGPHDNPQNWGKLLLKTIDLELDFSDIQVSDEMVVKNIISNLRERKLNAEVEIEAIQEQLNKYLAIEYNPEV